MGSWLHQNVMKSRSDHYLSWVRSDFRINKTLDYDILGAGLNYHHKHFSFKQASQAFSVLMHCFVILHYAVEYLAFLHNHHLYIP